jgi:flagellar FliL protein
MADDATSPSTEAAPAAPKAKRSYATALAIAAGLLGGGGLGTFISGPMLVKRLGVSARHAPAQASAVASASAEAPASEGRENKPGTAPTLVLVDNLVLNPAGSGGLRFLLVTVGMQLSNAANVEAAKTRDPEVRDILLRIMGNKRVDELADIRLRDGLKREIRVAMDAMMGRGSVKGVYFPQFVIQ